MNFAPISGTTARRTPRHTVLDHKSEQQSGNGQGCIPATAGRADQEPEPNEPGRRREFLSQLAQFSQLEQTMGIREGIDGLRTQVDSITAVLNNAQNKTEGE